MMREAEYNIYGIIDQVRRRPGMYINPISTAAMHTFLIGYSLAMDELGKTDGSTPHFREFHDWVSQKFGYGESTAGWSNMILAQTLGLSTDCAWDELLERSITPQQHACALQSFFCLLDEYRSQAC